MEFLRARSEEQKKVRLQQILSAANGLLDQYAYRDITLDMIAERLQFSRANIARYATSKEEIFLNLYVEDMLEVCQEILDGCQKRKMSIPEFAEFFADICVRHTNFMRLGAILDTIIELNIKTDRLADYKKIMLQKIAQVIGQLLNQFSFLSQETANEMVSMLIGYMAGLYPNVHLSPVQEEAILLSGMPYCRKELCTSIIRFVTIMLNGYQVLDN